MPMTFVTHLVLQHSEILFLYSLKPSYAKYIPILGPLRLLFPLLPLGGEQEIPEALELYHKNK